MNISATSGPIAIKLYLKHWDGGMAALGFGLARIRTLVPMATDSSHRAIMAKPCGHYGTFIFFQIFFILAGNMDNRGIWNELEFQPDPTTDCGVSCV